MRVHVVQLAYGDDEPVAARIDRVAALVAKQAEADLVVLPELWGPTGFGYRGWTEHAEPVDGPTVRALADAARSAGSAVHAGSILERSEEPGPEGRGLWNTSVLLDKAGEVQATYRKIHRFGFGGGEPALIEAGTDIVTATVPGGPWDPVAATVGFATCYDLRFPELFRRLVDAGATMFVVPAAWPAKRVAHWTMLGRARAIENQCVVVQCNTAGTHAGVPMGGHSQVVSPAGEVLAEAGPHDEEILVVNVDLAAVEGWRESFPVLGDRRL